MLAAVVPQQTRDAVADRVTSAEAGARVLERAVLGEEPYPFLEALVVAQLDEASEQLLELFVVARLTRHRATSTQTMRSQSFQVDMSFCIVATSSGDIGPGSSAAAAVESS